MRKEDETGFFSSPTLVPARPLCDNFLSLEDRKGISAGYGSILLEYTEEERSLT